MKLYETVIAAVLGGVIGCIATYLLLNERVSKLEQEVGYMTPVAVIDFFSIAEAYSEGAPVEVIDEEMRKLSLKAQKLAGQGFLIIQSDAAYSVPSEILIRHKAASKLPGESESP